MCNIHLERYIMPCLNLYKSILCCVQHMLLEKPEAVFRRCSVKRCSFLYLNYICPSSWVLGQPRTASFDNLFVNTSSYLQHSITWYCFETSQSFFSSIWILTLLLRQLLRTSHSCFVWTCCICLYSKDLVFKVQQDEQ